MTAHEAVMLGLAGRSSRRPTFARSERRRAHALLDRLGMAQLAGRQVAELSGGQLQRVLIARALITDPAIVLMDEPTSGLDLRRLREVLLLVRDLHRSGTTVVLTTHDLNWVAAQLPRVVFLDGSIVADGRPRDVVTTPLIDHVYGAPAKVIRDRRGNVVVLAQLETGDESPAERATIGSGMVTRRPTSTR
jgi:ABC-type cobalamin/Fe3+-siderophores transport system ATPase subunit